MSFRLEPLQDRWVEPIKALIAEIVLEFYGDIEWLPKSVPELLKHYENTGYLSDIDKYRIHYSVEEGAFFVLTQGEQVIGCGGLRRLNATEGELVRLWLKKRIEKWDWGECFLRS